MIGISLKTDSRIVQGPVRPFSRQGDFGTAPHGSAGSEATYQQ
jgi:hypothetical protein